MMSNEEPMSILVADFGEAFITNSSNSKGGGTILYMAPDRLNGSFSKVRNKSDLWSCGVIIYEMAYLELPFADLTSVLEENKLYYDDKTNLTQELKPLLEE